jgi:uncharacterized protein YbjT (DUF2867 family)
VPRKGVRATTTVAVIGATGIAGSRVVSRLQDRAVEVVQIDRAHGVDVVTGAGLPEALHGVDIVIDVSNPRPEGDYLGGTDIVDTLTAAARNVVGACTAHGIQRLVLLTIANVERPVFDGDPCCEGKRAAKSIVLNSQVPATLVTSTQFHEFATNPRAVICNDHEVVAQDWLIQPIAADTVADVLVEAALAQTRTPRTITGPHAIRLPQLTAKFLALQGDTRRVHTVRPVLPELASGALLAPHHAAVLGPDVDTWLQTLALRFTDGHCGQPKRQRSSDFSHI